MFWKEWHFSTSTFCYSDLKFKILSRSIFFSLKLFFLSLIWPQYNLRWTNMNPTKQLWGLRMKLVYYCGIPFLSEKVVFTIWGFRTDNLIFKKELNSVCLFILFSQSFFEGQSASWDVAKKDQNRAKNRYGNIIACKFPYNSWWM